MLSMTAQREPPFLCDHAQCPRPGADGLLAVRVSGMSVGGQRLLV